MDLAGATFQLSNAGNVDAEQTLELTLLDEAWSSGEAMSVVDSVEFEDEVTTDAHNPPHMYSQTFYTSTLQVSAVKRIGNFPIGNLYAEYFGPIRFQPGGMLVQYKHSVDPLMQEGFGVDLGDFEFPQEGVEFLFFVDGGADVPPYIPIYQTTQVWVTYGLFNALDFELTKDDEIIPAGSLYRKSGLPIRTWVFQYAALEVQIDIGGGQE